MNARVISCVVFGVGVSAPSLAGAPTPSASEIAERSLYMSYYQGKDMKARCVLSIEARKGRVRTREFTLLRLDMEGRGKSKDESGEARESVGRWARSGRQRLYLYFHHPDDVKGMSLLTWRSRGAPDARWLYLPALDLVKRIAPGDGRTRFAGSDFFYQDLSGRDPEDDAYVLRETTDDYYLLDATPVDAGSVKYVRVEAWIHRQSYLPVRLTYYDRKGQAYRKYETLEVKTIQGRQVATKVRMSDLKRGRSSTIEYSRISFDSGIKTEVFAERYLRMPPAEYIKK